MMPDQNNNARLMRILAHPSVFSQPHRLVAPSSWEAHIPFAFWIIAIHRPAFLVELGTYSGNSYCAFLQAFKELGISCCSFAIDTWEGDKHSGFYDNAVFEDLSAYHDAHYGEFSRLVRSRFDDARNHFADNSIDLLHIDGLHTYEAVKHDFDAWLPKMSSRGVVLIHDSNVRETDFGVWQLWEEMRKTYPHFTFTHGHGLGIAAVGKKISPELRSLFRLSVPGFENEERQVRSFFARLGNTFSERLQVGVLRERLSDQHGAIHKLTAEQEAANGKGRTQISEPDDALRRAQEMRENTALKSELEVAKSEREAAHEKLRLQIAEGRDALWRAQIALAQRASENDVMRRRLSTTAAEIEQIQRGLTQEVAENSELKTELQAAKHKAITEREQIELLKLQVLRLIEDNRLLRSSHSWRATAPLRFAGHGVRRIVKDLASLPLTGRWVPQRNLEMPDVRHGIPTHSRDDNIVRSTARDRLELAVPASETRHSGAPTEDSNRTSLKVSRIEALADASHSLPSSANNRKLFCLCHVVPWPPRAGNEYRIHRMLTWATRTGWDVFLLVAPLPDQEPDAEQIRKLCSVYPNVVVACGNGNVVYNLKQGSDVLSALNGQLTTDFANLLGESPSNDPIETWALHFQRTMASDVLITVLHALVRAIRPNVVLANYVFMARALALLPKGVLRLLDTHDVFSTKKETVERFGIGDKWLSTELETRLLKPADVIIAIQPEERAILSALAPGKTVIAAGVDFDFAPLDSSPEGRSILFVASGNSINVKGAQDFLRFAWPLLQRKVGDAELLVCGSVGDSIKVNDPRIRILGPVENLTPLYSKARVVINPAVAGTGLKVKTIEAIANLRPIVLWPLGASGLDPELKSYCTIAKNWYEFSVGIVEHLLDDTAMAKLRHNRGRVRELICADNVYSELANVLGQPC